MAPAKKAAAKKSTAKKSTAKKSTAKKTAAKKTAAKKSTAKKTTAKKSAAKKSTARKSTAARTAAAGASVQREAVVIASKLKEAVKKHDVRMASDFVHAVSEQVHDIVEKAAKRAKANRRSTVRPDDL
jgi:DNA-binding protein HU-beta